jgi:outer membrane protein assembly factor BamE (lipoprotein component of BamABCDE complex)
MMKKTHRFYLSIGLIFFALTGCKQKELVIEGIDLQKWHQDKNGCANIRSEMIARLDVNKENLLGHTEMEIVQYLGVPDVNEIYKRNQKFFYYYLQPSATCDQPVEHAHRLSIRFNAMGLAKEVIID